MQQIVLGSRQFEAAGQDNYLQSASKGTFFFFTHNLIQRTNAKETEKSADKTVQLPNVDGTRCLEQISARSPSSTSCRHENGPKSRDQIAPETTNTMKASNQGESSTSASTVSGSHQVACIRYKAMYHDSWN